MVAEFQHGLVLGDTVLIATVLILAGLAVAAIWMRLGITVRRRACESIAALTLAAVVMSACTLVRANWDASESRGNSLPEADEQALAEIHRPLRIEVHLAPEDPRRLDLEQRALSKLRRVMPKLEVAYVSATSIGLFEQTSAGYGEIWYSLGGRKTMSRVTTAEGVLEAIYSIAGIGPPKEDDDAVFRGHPLTARPRAAAVLFYGVWPAMTLGAGFLVRRRFL
jgi:hypothetical protein